MKTFQEYEERCNSDPAFREMVAAMEMAIEHLQLTPGEVKQCAMYAAIRFEMRYTHVHVVPASSTISPSELEALRSTGVYSG